MFSNTFFSHVYRNTEHTQPFNVGVRVECEGSMNSDNLAILPNHRIASIWIQREVPQGQHIAEHLLL
jgi:hypothetical protein